MYLKSKNSFVALDTPLDNFSSPHRQSYQMDSLHLQLHHLPLVLKDHHRLCQLLALHVKASAKITQSPHTIVEK